MTEAALAPESPHAPSVIRLLLGKLGIAYEEVLDHHGLNASRKVQAVLLDDAVGALMVLFPQNQLLDLNRIAELTGRKLTAVSKSAWIRCSAKQSAACQASPR
jgi:prolyl-tRNA editing enzyme YbaK/EbsC (Cys-tRNA(Pro) deacylase)